MTNLRPGETRWLKRLVTILSVTAIIAGVTVKHEAPAAEAQSTCQLTPTNGARLVNFNNARLFSNRGASQAVAGPFSLPLTTGQYRVTLQSYDVHLGRDTATQGQEQWFLELRNDAGQTITATNPVSDLPDDQDSISLTVNTSLTVNQAVTSLLVKHLAYPSNRANSIEAICATFEPLSSSTPTPTPSPTPTPTSSPTATPTPTTTPANNQNNNDENNNDDDSDDAPGLSISKDDDRDFTRPGQDLTYQIRVKNNGTGTIADAKITDTLPEEVTLEEVSSGAEINGNQVSWSDIGLSDGETVSFSLTVKVDDDVSSGHTLVNTVKVRSEDSGLSATDTDLTVVQRPGQVAAATDNARIAQATTSTPATTNTNQTAAQDVPVTAATGGSPIFAATSSLLGLAGLALSRRLT